MKKDEEKIIEMFLNFKSEYDELEKENYRLKMKLELEQRVKHVNHEKILLIYCYCCAGGV